MATIKVKPNPDKKGVKVRKPDTGKYLDAKGETVKKTAFWVRRIKDGDVIDLSTPKKTATKTVAAKGE